MKKTLFILILSFLITAPVGAVGVNDFYFSDFTGDYYLSRDEEGISHLRVIESVTAVFPDYNQNKGICRQIPFTNQDGKNVTLPSLTRANLKLTRNGNPENIYSIDREGNYYNVCTGTEEYVLGAQTYVFEYEFVKVVTEFDGYQELYWDTNGHGALQRFDKVTARLHFENPEVWSGESWCYVGRYGESGQERCTTTKLDDGVQFTAENLKAGENLTYDAELKAGSFTVPEPDKNYAYVWLIGILSAICLVFIIIAIRKFVMTREKANYYKGLFVKPEYQPSKDYSLAEMAEIYLGKKKDYKVAMLLEMIVKHQVELVKDEKKKWSLIVKKINEISSENVSLLTILNNGLKPGDEDTIKIERHSASTKLISLKKAMESKILGDLKKDELVEKKYHIGSSSSKGVGNVVAMVVVMVPVIIMLGTFVIGMLSDFIGLNSSYGGELVFEEGFFRTAFIIIIVTVIVWSSLKNASEKYEEHTKKGLEASRYMDGLKLYIGMAEAERLKFLQSVDGADVSAEGIVKLYEKLLPYAAVFGLEESWMKEMKEYCEVQEIEEPDYLLAGFTASEMLRTMNNASSYISNSTVMSSSGGGSSSGFSGGGGGGFSGGGGGGGGFSGR